MMGRIMKRLLGFFGGIAAGVALAMLIGWVLFPMQPRSVGPDTMRSDYQSEYVRLAAAAYRVDHDLDLASERLRRLEATPSTDPLVDLTERWIDAGRPSMMVGPLVELAQALEVDTPVMAPYLVAESAP